MPAQSVGEDHQSVIIGTDDLVPVDEDGGNIPARYTSLLDAIGLVQPVGCTAVHIGDGIVLTAGHCVDPSRVDCSRLEILWGFRGAQHGITSTCASIIAFQHDENADWAVIKVVPTPPAVIPVDACSEPAPGAAVTIFSHPNLMPLEWSNVCVIEPASQAGRSGIEFAHACDTLAGSSGAPIIDDTSLRVVGIHNGGSAPWNYGTFVSPIPYFDAARVACWCGKDQPGNAS
jgi:V8-like Glu-specific endopeptidase